MFESLQVRTHAVSISVRHIIVCILLARADVCTSCSCSSLHYYLQQVVHTGLTCMSQAGCASDSRSAGMCHWTAAR